MKSLAAAALLLFLSAATALPQCAMCREAAASQNERGIRAFNAAILMLGAPPAFILAGIGWAAYRRRDR